jgi:hypothetical protein
MNTTFKTLMASALAASSLAFAQPQPPPQRNGEMGQQMRERFERKARMMRMLEISDALNLSDQEALRFNQVMSRYDQKKESAMQSVHQGMQVLRRASKGDATAFGEVDSTVQKLQQARAQIEAIDREMFNELGKSLDPQRRAKLALVLAHLPGQMRDLMRGGRGERDDGPHGHHGGPPAPNND